MDLKAEKARDKVAEAAKQIDDQLAGGASLIEAGKPLGLTPAAIKGVDAHGKHMDGTLAPELKGRAEILKTAFETDKDAPAQIKQDGKDAAFAVAVEAITPPALRPLGVVKAKVVEGYTAEAKATAATDKAQALIEKSKAGASFKDLADQADTSVTSIGPVLRTTRDKAISPRVLTTLFALTRVGDVAVASTAEGPVLVKLGEIAAPAPQSADDKAAAEKRCSHRSKTMRAAIRKGATRDLSGQDRSGRGREDEGHELSLALRRDWIAGDGRNWRRP